EGVERLWCCKQNRLRQPVAREAHGGLDYARVAGLGQNDTTTDRACPRPDTFVEAHPSFIGECCRSPRRIGSDTKGDGSPSSRVISRTSDDDRNDSSAAGARNTVSTCGLSSRFISAIWNSYSKSWTP